jgi:glycerol transport system ATP-binding protein
VGIGREGMRVAVSKVEDIGRHKIVHAALDERQIAAIVPEEAEVPVEAHISFDPAGINLYADSWRVEMV